MDEILSIDAVDFSSVKTDASESMPPADRPPDGDPVTTTKNNFSDAESGFAGT